MESILENQHKCQELALKIIDEKVIIKTEFKTLMHKYDEELFEKYIKRIFYKLVKNKPKYKKWVEKNIDKNFLKSQLFLKLSDKDKSIIINSLLDKTKIIFDEEDLITNMHLINWNIYLTNPFRRYFNVIVMFSFVPHLKNFFASYINSYLQQELWNLNLDKGDYCIHPYLILAFYPKWGLEQIRTQLIPFIYDVIEWEKLKFNIILALTPSELTYIEFLRKIKPFIKNKRLFIRNINKEYFTEDVVKLFADKIDYTWLLKTLRYKMSSEEYQEYDCYMNEDEKQLYMEFRYRGLL